MNKASIALGLFVAMLLMPIGVNAQQWRTLSAEEQAPWAAVGKIVRGRIDAQGFCTATLINPDTVLTAAHCVYRKQGFTPSQLRQFVFVAGWNNGQALASSIIREVIISDSYERSPKIQLDLLNHDWAILKLAEPITNIRPMPVVAMPGPWEPVYFISYSKVTPEAPQLTTGCQHRIMEEGPMQIACPAISGNSGAAVLVGRPEDAQIVAVLAAQGNGNAFAVIPDEELLSIINGSE